MRERLLISLGVVGASMVFLAIAIGRSRFMSIPCPTCGRREDIRLIDPIGTHLDKAILWLCRCGNSRAVLIDRFTPRSLIEKALAQDDKLH